MSLSAEIGAAVTKMTPPAAVILAGAAGWGPQEWMYAVTAVYVVVQTLYLAWKWIREYRAGRNTQP
jgi:hypothetical protein